MDASVGAPRPPASVRLLAAVAVAMAGASVVVVPGPGGWLGAALAPIVVLIADADARRFIIPDGLNAAGLALGLVHAAVAGERDVIAAVGDATLRAGATAAMFFALWAGYRALRGREGIGLGDVKLAAVAGAWLDWSMIPVAVELAALSALAGHLWRLKRRRRIARARARLPFGLFFAPAIWIGWLAAGLLPG